MAFRLLKIKIANVFLVLFCSDAIEEPFLFLKDPFNAQFINFHIFINFYEKIFIALFVQWKDFTDFRSSS